MAMARIVSPHAAGQKALALLLGAEAREVGADQAAVQGAVPVTDPGVGRLLDDDLLEAEVVVAHAAILLVGPHHEKTLLAGLAETPRDRRSPPLASFSMCGTISALRNLR
jgi:hypothetical protein